MGFCHLHQHPFEFHTSHGAPFLTLAGADIAYWNKTSRHQVGQDLFLVQTTQGNAFSNKEDGAISQLSRHLGDKQHIHSGCSSPFQTCHRLT